MNISEFTFLLQGLKWTIALSIIAFIGGPPGRPSPSR